MAAPKLEYESPPSAGGPGRPGASFAFVLFVFWAAGAFAGVAAEPWMAAGRDTRPDAWKLRAGVGLSFGLWFVLAVPFHRRLRRFPVAARLGALALGAAPAVVVVALRAAPNR